MFAITLLAHRRLFPATGGSGALTGPGPCRPAPRSLMPAGLVAACMFVLALVCLPGSPADAEIIKDRVRIARSLVNLTLFIDHHHGIGTVRLAKKKGWPKSVKLVFNHFPMLERLALDNGHDKIDLGKPEVQKLGFSTESFTYLVPSRFVSTSDQYIEVSWIDAYR